MVLNNKRESRNDSPCIWMQAGVVPKKLCRLQYQCTACAYDRAMRRVASENKQLNKDGKTVQGKRGRVAFWKDKLREWPGSSPACTI